MLGGVFIKNEFAQTRGKQAKADGAIFEEILSSACNYYQEKDIAFIEKTPEPFHILKREKGYVLGYYEKKGQPDFKGTLCDGTAIIFEAKYTNNNRINYQRLTDVQKESLELYEKYHAQVFVMVCIGFINYYRVPWNIWKSMKEKYGRLYMTQEELEEYRVPVQKGIPLILEGLELKSAS